MGTFCLPVPQSGAISPALFFHHHPTPTLPRESKEHTLKCLPGLPHSAGGTESKTMGSAGPCPLCPLGAGFPWFAGNLSIPCLVDSSPRSPSSCSHSILLALVSVYKLLFILRTPVLFDQGFLCSSMSSSGLVTSAMTLFPNVTFCGPGA